MKNQHAYTMFIPVPNILTLIVGSSSNIKPKRANNTDLQLNEECYNEDILSFLWHFLDRLTTYMTKPAMKGIIECPTVDFCLRMALQRTSPLILCMYVAYDAAVMINSVCGLSNAAKDSIVDDRYGSTDAWWIWKRSTKLWIFKQMKRK